MAKTGAFVQLPYDERVLAAAARRDASMAVLVELAYRVFRQRTKTVELPNEKLGAVGISRHAKTRALRHLAADGLVAVEWRRRKTPLVTVLWG